MADGEICPTLGASAPAPSEIESTSQSTYKAVSARSLRRARKTFQETIGEARKCYRILETIEQAEQVKFDCVNYNILVLKKKYFHGRLHR